MRLFHHPDRRRRQLQRLFDGPVLDHPSVAATPDDSCRGPGPAHQRWSLSGGRGVRVSLGRLFVSLREEILLERVFSPGTPTRALYLSLSHTQTHTQDGCIERSIFHALPPMTLLPPPIFVDSSLFRPCVFRVSHLFSFDLPRIASSSVGR